MTKQHAWSHSAIKDYLGCARRYHEVRVLKKHPFTETEATRYGNRLHEAAEFYIRDGKPLPKEFEFIKGTVDAFMRKPGRKFAEFEMALTHDLQPCHWKSPEAWVRGIADVLIVNDEGLTAWVGDWKSGNNKYPDRDQLRLMSLMVFAHFPLVRKVKSALLFVVKNDMVKMTMERDEAEAAWWKYREDTAKLEESFASGVWNPQQSGLCKKHCPCVGCEYNGNH